MLEGPYLKQVILLLRIIWNDKKVEISSSILRLALCAVMFILKIESNDLVFALVWCNGMLEIYEEECNARRNV